MWLGNFTNPLPPITNNNRTREKSRTMMIMRIDLTCISLNEPLHYASDNTGNAHTLPTRSRGPRTARNRRVARERRTTRWSLRPDARSRKETILPGGPLVLTCARRRNEEARGRSGRSFRAGEKGSSGRGWDGDNGLCRDQSDDLSTMVHGWLVARQAPCSSRAHSLEKVGEGLVGRKSVVSACTARRRCANVAAR